MKYFLIIFCSVFIFSSCKFELNKDKSKESDKVEHRSSKDKDSDDPFDKLSKTLDDLSEGKSVETVPYQDLQNLLPKKLEGFERVDTEGSRTGILGMKVSTASATYEKRGNEIEINIVDGGSFGAVLAMADWSEIEFDRSHRDGFERTNTLKGNKSYEKFEKNGESEIAIILHNRFLVTASGRVDDFDDLREMVESLKLNRLPKE